MADQKKKKSRFAEFTETSTIHGISHFAGQHHNITEKILLAIAFTISLICCAFLIKNAYVRWIDHPILISFATKPASVWKVPFPAITICPEVKTQKRLFDFAQTLEKLVFNASQPIGNDTYEKFQIISHLCPEWMAFNLSLQALDLHLGDEIADANMVDVIKNLSISMDEDFFIRGFNHFNFFASKYVQETLTAEGICLTYNSFEFRDMYKDGIHPDFKKNLKSRRKHIPDVPQWSLEYGFDESIQYDKFRYPYRSNLATKGIEAMLFSTKSKDIDDVCTDGYLGYKLFLHAPNEVPNHSRHFKNIRVPLKYAVKVAVTPNLITTSDGLRDYDPNRRQCYYSSERHLRFFQHYTRSNCELECLANFTLTFCGCVQFSMPRDKTTPICGARKIQCYTDAIAELHKPDRINGEQSLPICDCLPHCNGLSYNAESFKIKYDFNKMVGFTSAKNDALSSRVSISFQDDYFTAAQRSEIYGDTDFLAYCGGLISLCVGASILSIIELVYFCLKSAFLKCKEILK